jgi:hypothetical protein
MLNYVQHRAIFEGMNAHLWAPNTGRMLWMTQPAWPSSTWQILSSDYDTQASFYAVKKASETLHVQLDPTTYHVQVANSLPAAVSGYAVSAKVYSLDNRVLEEHQEKKDVPTGVIDAFPLDLREKLKNDVAFVKLELRDSLGRLVSDNFYWVGGDTSDYRKLNRLPTTHVEITANVTRKTGVTSVHVRLENKGPSAAIETKLTLLESDGRTRVLPAYYGDNYISLMPGEIREMDVETPSSAIKTGAMLAVRGWNVNESPLKIGGVK